MILPDQFSPATAGKAFLSLFTVTLITFGSLSAQEKGWTLLAEDDHVGAREWFESRLSEDSLDLSALRGMIILSDIHGDGLHLREYITRYVTTTWDDNAYRVLKSYVALSDTAVVASPMSNEVKITSRIDLAGEHFYHRQPEKAEKAYRELIPENRWSMIGPFENVGGSGYITEFDVEKVPFDPDGAYPNEIGRPIRWNRPAHVRATGEVEADHFVPGGDDKVAYANTFLSVPEDRTVELRLARSSPITIWLDDHVVFTSPERIGLEYDGEIIRLNLKKGTHRILVKTAPYYKGRDSYGILRTSVPRSPLVSSYSSAAGRWEQGYFALRFTDREGNAFSDMTLAYDGEYTPTSYTPEVTSGTLLAHWLGKANADQSDLFAAYMLTRAYLITGRSEEGEEYFYHRLASDDNVALRWMLGRLYASNGKVEKMYDVLKPADDPKTPIFGLLEEKLEEIDAQVREEEFLELYGQLRRIAPSNYSIIQEGIDFYDMKDQKKEKDSFIDEVVAAYPEYEEYLESDRSDYKYRSEIDERSPREIADSLLLIVEEEVDMDAYDELIDYFTDKKEVEKVIELHDERIAAWPSYTYYLRQKAEYLREEKMYEEGIETLKRALTIVPYSASTHELIGDMYDHMDDQENALEWYRKGLAVDISGYSHRRGYRENSLIEKIENIEGKVDVEGLFTGELTFEEGTANTGWMEEYGDEESVIPLYEKRQVIDKLGRIRTFSKIQIRILTEAGADWWTEYNFGALGDLNRVRVMKAGGGEAVPDRRGSMVVFKNLEPGDMIEIEGQEEQTVYDDLFDGDFFDISFLSFGAPIHRARVEILTPAGEPIYYLHHQLEDNLQKSRAGDYDSWVWDYTNLDRVPDEDATLDQWDGLRTIFVSSMADWSRVVDWYQRKTYLRTEPSYDVRLAVDSVVTPGMSDAEKIRAVYDYVTRQINYSHVSFLQSAYTPKAADLTLSSNVGDCKDVATLMIAMLKQVGVDAWFTLVKTTGFNHQKFLPSQLFDHVIVGLELEGEEHYMDLTTNFFPHTVLPFNDCGAWALNIREGETEVFQLPDDHVDPEKNMITIDVTAVLDTSRAVDLEVAAEHAGLEGAYIRESMAQRSREEFRNEILDLLGKGTFQDLRLEEYEVENRMEMNEPLRSTYQFTGERFSDKVSNLYIFRLPWMLAIRNNNAIKTPERVTSLNVLRLCETAPSLQRATLRFPDGYEMTELPANVEVTSEFGTYRLTFTAMPGGLRVEKYQEFATTRIPPQKFEEFRDFYLRLLDLDEGRYAIIRPKSQGGGL